jgi:hypothetical protein
VGDAYRTNVRGEKVHKVSVGKPEGKRLFGTPRRRWKDGLRLDLG